MSIAFYSVIILCLLLFPDICAVTAQNALLVWGRDVVPSLFPYMYVSRLLCEKLRQTSLPAFPAVAVLGMLGGSPSGASVLHAYAAYLPRRSVLALCALTGTISPMFLLSTVNAWIQNTDFCRFLLLCHWCGAVFSSVCVFLFYRDLKVIPPSRVQSAPARSVLSQSIDAILQVGGCIISYSVMAGLITKLPMISAHAGAYLHAFLEVSGGVYALCQIHSGDMLQQIELAILTGFTGLSILSQNHAVLRPLGIRRSQLFFFAALRAIGAGMSAILLLCFIG